MAARIEFTALLIASLAGLLGVASSLASLFI